ncbi:MAG: alkaline shock response membrane anchor protein AmaP [Selenomonadaceae bacterium]|nr:alkaline shock response membrane anchor protein AmaP [Selenomonadaceae bacterium]
MGIINRFLWLITAVMSLAVGAVTAAVWLNLVPEPWWLNEWHYALTRSETIMVIALYFLLNLHLLACALSGSQKEEVAPKEFVILKGAYGETKVAAAAITAVIERVATSVMTVREAKAEIASDAKNEAVPIRVLLKLTVLTEANVEDISRQVMEAVQAQLKQNLGMDKVPVAITVTGISNAPVEKRRVK